MSVIEICAFAIGAILGITMMGIVHLGAVVRWRSADREFRAQQRKRIDELAEWSERSYAQARKDAGLPPRSTS